MVEGGGPHLTQVALNAEVGLTRRWSLRLNLPAQGGTGTGWSPWDAVVGASYRPIDRPDLSLSLRPGLTLPVGPSGPTASFVPGTTGSPDPWLAAALFAGERWLFAGQTSARVPLVAGRDGVVQGTWVRLDLGLGRRLGAVTAVASASGVERRNDDTGRGGFTEVAAQAETIWAFAPEWAGSVQLRTPLWMTTESPYAVAGGLSLTRVWGKAAPADAHAD